MFVGPQGRHVCSLGVTKLSTNMAALQASNRRYRIFYELFQIFDLLKLGRNNFMPELSRFYGIVIYMFAKDHPPPHCHAKYGEHVGLINIRTGEMIKGNLPRRALRLLQDWVELHENELMKNWNESQKDNPAFQKIKPLQ